MISFLRLPHVMEKTGISRSSIYAKVHNGTFPKPIKLSTRMIGWIEADIDAWQQKCIAKARGKAA